MLQRQNGCRMLPYKFSLPFLSLPLHNKRIKACFQSERTGTKADTEEGTDLPLLSLSLRGAWADSHRSDSKKPNLLIHLFSFTAEGRVRTYEEGGEIRGCRKWTLVGGLLRPCVTLPLLWRGVPLAPTVALLYPDGPHAALWVSRHCWAAIVHMLVSFSSGQTSSKIWGHDPASDQIT